MAAMRVLLAEDDETKAVQTQSMLRDAEDTEVAVDWVSSAAEALRHTTRGGYDAYLIDVTLGETSGLDVLRQAIEAGCHAPIVLLAEYGEGGPRHRGAAPRRGRLPGQGRDHRAATAAGGDPRDRARPRVARAARERGPPAAGRAHREPGPSRRRHRPRLQQPAHRHPELHVDARGADRGGSSGSGADRRRAPHRRARGAAGPPAARLRRPADDRADRDRSEPRRRRSGRDAAAAGRRSPDLRRRDDAAAAAGRRRSLADGAGRDEPGPQRARRHAARRPHHDPHRHAR